MRLEERAKALYKWALKKSILDYILLDPTERVRLRIFQVELGHEPCLIRGPLPWHNNVVTCREVMRNSLFHTHPVIIALRRLWDSK
jgi:dynein heavy chain